MNTHLRNYILILSFIKFPIPGDQSLKLCFSINTNGSSALIFMSTYIEPVLSKQQKPKLSIIKNSVLIQHGKIRIAYNDKIER